MTTTRRDPRLDAFHKDMSWTERVGVIHKQFPSTTNLDWKKAFDEDLDLFGRIIRDILKLDQVEPGRSGPRPALEMMQAHRSLRALSGDDYATVPFREAYRALTHGRSLRGLSAKTSLAKSRLHRLMTGEIEPTFDDMEKIAGAFKKHASYFAEWRAGFVTAIVNDRLAQAPEASIVYYDRLAKAAAGE